MPGAEQRLGELPDDRGAAEPGERIVALQRRDDRAVREALAGPVVVGDDDLEPEPRRLVDLGDGGDPAVDREHELDPLVGEPRERLRRRARSPPRSARADASRARRRARAAGRRRARWRRCRRRRSRRGRRSACPAATAARIALDRLGHVAERERIVAGQRAFEERARRRRVGVAAAHEHRGERRALIPSSSASARTSTGRARGDRPGRAPSAIEGTEQAGRRLRQRLCGPQPPFGQLHPEVGEDDDGADERRRAEPEQPLVPDVADRVGEGAAEQDQDAAIEADADDEDRRERGEPLPVGVASMEHTVAASRGTARRFGLFWERADGRHELLLGRRLHRRVPRLPLHLQRLRLRAAGRRRGRRSSGSSRRTSSTRTRRPTSSRSRRRA